MYIYRASLCGPASVYRGSAADLYIERACLALLLYTERACGHAFVCCIRNIMMLTNFALHILRLFLFLAHAEVCYVFLFHLCLEQPEGAQVFCNASEWKEVSHLVACVCAQAHTWGVLKHIHEAYTCTHLLTHMHVIRTCWGTEQGWMMCSSPVYVYESHKRNRAHAAQGWMM